VAFAEPHFRLSEERLDDVTQVIAVGGEIHVSTAPEFSRALAAALGDGAGRVVLDLSAVEFIDSTGLSVLLNGLRRVTRRGGRMAIVCTNPTVLRLFEITRLDSTFDIHPTREAAIESVRGGYNGAAGDSSDGAP
jgi:anti-sigma B factor antagonist